MSNRAFSSELKNYALAALSALLLSLAFSSFNIWFCAWVGLVPLLWAIKGKTAARAFLIAFACGVFFWAGTIYWLAHVTLIGLLLLVIYLALYFGLWGGLVAVLSSKCARWQWFIGFSWVLLEYVRANIFTGFGWAFLGYSQAGNIRAIQIADITGSWGVSFLIITANTGLYAVLSAAARNNYKQAVKRLLIFGCAAVIILTYGQLRIKNIRAAFGTKSKLRVSVIQAGIAQELKWDPQAAGYILDAYSRLTMKAASDKPDLIVWPEAASPDILDARQPGLAWDMIRSLTKKSAVPLLFGAVTAEQGSYFNSALLLDHSGKLVDKYHKMRLVPFGEYIPLKRVLPFLETIVPIGDIQRGGDYRVFAQPARFSVLICFEDLFPGFSRKFTKDGAGFLVNITNDAWYKKTSAAWQHLQAAVFRAVENRRFLVRAANTGISCFIHPDGKMISSVSSSSGQNLFVSGYLTENIAVSSGINSAYTKFGDWFILLSGIVTVCGLLLCFKPGSTRP